MREQIEAINAAIATEGEQLQREVEGLFDRVNAEIQDAQTAGRNAIEAHSAGREALPPATYLFSGMAIATTICGFFVADSAWGKTLNFAIAALSAFGAYKTMPKKSGSGSVTDSSTGVKSLDSVKLDVREQVLKGQQQVSSEWEQFMTEQKGKVQAIIEEGPGDSDSKASQKSKTYAFKVIGFSAMDAFSTIGGAGSFEELREACGKVRKLWVGSIEETVKRQIEVYRSIE